MPFWKARQRLELGFHPASEMFCVDVFPCDMAGPHRYHYAQRKKKFPNVPAALPLVVAELAKCYGVSGAEIARVTTYNATQFFRL